MNSEKVLKFGAISLILYYLRNYIARGMVGCEYIWKDSIFPKFLNGTCCLVFIITCLISLIMWVTIIYCIFLIFKKDKTSKKEVENG